MRKVTVLYNLPITFSEADLDTQKTAQDVANVLSNEGYKTEILGINVGEVNKVRKIKADVVFNLIEWTGKELVDAINVIDALGEIGVAYTGSDSRGYKLSCDKIIMKTLMDKNKILTPKWMYFETGEEKIKTTLPYPMILKPAFQHCGIGLTQDSLANNAKELRDKAKKLLKEFNEPVIAEEYIEGRELHVTMLEKNGKPMVLPASEVTYKKKKGYVPILSYDMKWKEDSWEYTMAGNMEIAKLNKKLELDLKKVAEKSYLKLGGRDYPRIDTRIRDGKIYVLEINNNPGIDFEIDSGIGRSAQEMGFTYGSLLKHIVENAYLRFKKGKYDSTSL